VSDKRSFKNYIEKLSKTKNLGSSIFVFLPIAFGIPLAGLLIAFLLGAFGELLEMLSQVILLLGLSIFFNRKAYQGENKTEGQNHSRKTMEKNTRIGVCWWKN
jgi:hypothetical protein